MVTMLFATNASAQEATVTNTPPAAANSVSPVRKTVIQDALDANRVLRQDALKQAEEMKKELRETNESARGEVRTLQEGIRKDPGRKREDIRSGTATSSREELKRSMEEQRESVKQRMEQVEKEIEVRREEFKQTMEVKREEAKRTIEARREELKTKLETIRDERKRTAVETIDKRLEEINANRLEHFSNAITQLEKVLQSVESRTTKAEEAGKDVAGVRTDIAAATATISAARAAIVTQAANSYVLTIGLESALRTDVGETRQRLQADLKVAQDAVRAVQTAIRKAATDLAKIPGINTVDQPTGTSTATSTDDSNN